MDSVVIDSYEVRIDGEVVKSIPEDASLEDQAMFYRFCRYYVENHRRVTSFVDTPANLAYRARRALTRQAPMG